MQRNDYLFARQLAQAQEANLRVALFLAFEMTYGKPEQKATLNALKMSFPAEWLEWFTRSGKPGGYLESELEAKRSQDVIWQVLSSPIGRLMGGELHPEERGEQEDL